nr:mpv17-like protein isoform X2 [Paramormyrops kingsleyae]XP_023685921.1 mpv17-like protein isoform X2 [Paramormyrops kingsleyae]
MNRVWSMFRSHTYVTNVIGYTALFATADLIQQSVLDQKRVGADITPSGQHQRIANEASESRNVTPDIKLKQKTDSSPEPQKGLESEQSETGNLGKANLISKEIESSSKMKSGTWSGVNWDQTARVALVGFSFHANFNYHWLKGLERMLPGTAVKRVSVKVLLDQVIAAPATITVFYIGLSALEGRQELFEDWREKFWTSYKTGVVYWSTMQVVNFSLVPPVARTVFVGGVALIWTVFLCHFRQQRG